MSPRHRRVVEPAGWRLAGWTVLGSSPFWASFALYLVVTA